MVVGKLDGRVAIVTGGARGMGEAEVRLFVAEGARVLCCDIIDAEGQALSAELGQDKVRYLHLDVRDKAGWAAAVEQAEASFGPVSVLVNNAGVFTMAAIEEMPEDDFRRVIDINLVGTFFGMQAVVASMRRAGGGSIVNISSTAGFVGMPEMGAYAASKFAVRGITKVAALELGADNIRVNSVHPGPTRTAMTSGGGNLHRMPLERFADPVELARLVLFLACDDSSFSTGSEFVADGGLLCVVGPEN